MVVFEIDCHGPRMRATQFSSGAVRQNLRYQTATASRDHLGGPHARAMTIEGLHLPLPIKLMPLDLSLAFPLSRLIPLVMSYPAQVTREKILARSVALIEKKGELSLQELARSLGIRAPSLYRYFDSRERLIAAVGLAGFRKLAGYIRSTTRHDPSLRAAACAIRRFAKKHPALYRVMNESDARHEDPQEAREVTREVLTAAFGERVPDDTIPTLGATLTAIRAFIHGFAMLEISGQFQDERHLDKSFEAGLDALLAAFEKQLRK